MMSVLDSVMSSIKPEKNDPNVFFQNKEDGSH